MEGPFKRLVKTLVPAPVRRRLREIQAELPTRLSDAPGDLAERLRISRRIPLPPGHLRARVGRSRSRAEFGSAGNLAARSVLEVLARQTPRPAGPWLDFGCGSGRLARHFLAEAGRGRLVGADVDLEALAWCARHLPAGFVTIPGEAMLPFREGTFAVVVASSVFTHLDRAPARAWLLELERVLVPGGLLLASTHSERLVHARPDLTAEDHRRLVEEGFVFRAGPGPFNDDCAFHTRTFLERDWGTVFLLVEHIPHGLAGYQDLTVWRRRESVASERPRSSGEAS
jgi:SAM-dependent methyltransferase